MKIVRNMPMLRKPTSPSVLYVTAHGYMKITSTSKRTNRMAVRKYLMLKGIRAFPTAGKPASNISNLFLVRFLGPILCVTKSVVTTKPAPSSACIATGRYCERTLCDSIVCCIAVYFQAARSFASSDLHRKPPANLALLPH